MLKVEVDGNSIRLAMKELDNINPELRKTMKRELASALEGMANEIKSAAPSTAPLSGMNNNGRLRYGKVRKPTVSVTPGRSKRGVSFISIKVGATPEAGFKMAELAGSRMQIKTRQGANFIRVMNERYPMQGKAGRFAYSKFRALRPEVITKATEIVERYMALVNRKL